MNYFIGALKKYAVFSGRARRAEYWYFVLFTFLIGFVLMFVDSFLGLVVLEDARGENGIGVLGGIFQLAILLPSIAVGVRRMHDVDKSGWFILVPIYSIILAIRKGVEGENKYGPNPIEPVVTAEITN